MQIETWYKVLCDECNVVNWLCDGDTSDLTRPCIDGFICHKCRAACHLEDDPTWIEIFGGDDPEGYEIGLERPI